MSLASQGHLSLTGGWSSDEVTFARSREALDEFRRKTNVVARIQFTQRGLRAFVDRQRLDELRDHIAINSPPGVIAMKARIVSTFEM